MKYHENTYRKINKSVLYQSYTNYCLGLVEAEWVGDTIFEAIQWKLVYGAL
jgi:hypothetical protein